MSLYLSLCRWNLTTSSSVKCRTNNNYLLENVWVYFTFHHCLSCILLQLFCTLKWFLSRLFFLSFHFSWQHHLWPCAFVMRVLLYCIMCMWSCLNMHHVFVAEIEFLTDAAMATIFWLSVHEVHIGATLQILLNRPSAAAMRPYVKLLWPLVTVVVIVPNKVHSVYTLICTNCVMFASQMYLMFNSFA